MQDTGSWCNRKMSHSSPKRPVCPTVHNIVPAACHKLNCSAALDPYRGTFIGNVLNSSALLPRRHEGKLQGHEGTPGDRELNLLSQQHTSGFRGARSALFVRDITGVLLNKT